MSERQLNMQRDITPEWEKRMEQLMEIPCVHSVNWYNSRNIDIIYIAKPTEEQKEQIKLLTK